MAAAGWLPTLCVLWFLVVSGSGDTESPTPDPEVEFTHPLPGGEPGGEPEGEVGPSTTPSTAAENLRTLPDCSSLQSVSVNFTQLSGRWLSAEEVFLTGEVPDVPPPYLQELCSHLELLNASLTRADLVLLLALNQRTQRRLVSSLELLDNGHLHSDLISTILGSLKSSGHVQLLAADPERFLAFTLCLPSPVPETVRSPSLVDRLRWFWRSETPLEVPRFTSHSVALYTRELLSAEQLEDIWSELDQLLGGDMMRHGEIVRHATHCFTG